ncbi:MAG: N-6 DNA methylase [Planctomycetota bacterium]
MTNCGSSVATSTRRPRRSRLQRCATPRAGDGAFDVTTGDGLLDDTLAPGTFDCVLTNPPWETLQSGADAPARVRALRPRFVHQGSGKLYTYRLFVERALQLLRPGGRLGMVVPASLWFDRDAEPLRRLLLDECDWQWLFGFENRDKVFAIDSRYRFAVVLASKGGSTKNVRVAFGRTALAEWAAPAPQHVRYRRDELRLLSPHSGAFVEAEHRRDLDVLRRMHEAGRPLLGDADQGAFSWRQGDFNMTSHKAHFVLREHAERDGARHVGDGTFVLPDGRRLLSLVQGAMVYDLDANAGAHLDGTGHKTRWRAALPGELRPLYLVDADAWREAAATRPTARLVLRALSNATNERTAIACLLPDLPCGNSLGVIAPPPDEPRPLRALAASAAVLSSLAFDWSLRLRLGGTNLNGFVLRDCVVPRLDDAVTDELARAALRLCSTAPWCAPLLVQAANEGWRGDAAPAHDPAERRALFTLIDRMVGDAFGLDADDITWITRGCGDTDRGERYAKGFWRLDRELPAADRRPARWLSTCCQGGPRRDCPV